MTFFVSNSNYLMTIISLVDRKGFRLEMLDWERISKNYDFKKESSEKGGEDSTKSGDSSVSKVVDFRLKERITMELRAGTQTN